MSGAGEEVAKTFAKGQEIEALILNIDPERERISLGLKQLESDPVAEYLQTHTEGEKVLVKVISVESKRAIVEIATNVEGVLKVADYDVNHTDDLTNDLTVGEQVEVKITKLDPKSLQISVSRKALFDENLQSQTPKPMTPTKTTLGDLLKEKISKNGDSDDSK